VSAAPLALPLAGKQPVVSTPRHLNGFSSLTRSHIVRAVAPPPGRRPVHPPACNFLAPVRRCDRFQRNYTFSVEETGWWLSANVFASRSPVLLSSIDRQRTGGAPKSTWRVSYHVFPGRATARRYRV